MRRTVTRVGPADHGRRMGLQEFRDAEVQPGYHYELRRGVVVVSSSPDVNHAAQVDRVRRQLAPVRESGAIKAILDWPHGKIPLRDLETVCHPDLCVYLAPVPMVDDPWDRWIPAIVVEVVSPSSVERDYEEKPNEYLAGSVAEYWIIDADKREMTVFRRRGKSWESPRVVRPPEAYETPSLPGLEFDCKAVFDAARGAR
jgi:Uma2 family endonuclease